jgi:uncharacterized protein YdhG (YjbR/CyaY superfamily)
MQAKSKAKFTSMDQYIKSFPADVQFILQKVRETIRKVAPDAEETISYQIPTFKLNGNLVHFAAFKNHIGFYPASEGISKFAKEIAKYKNAKGSVQFPLDMEIPYDLIAEITEFRVAQNRAKKK